MKFESLPNEILIECFGYFNGVELFYSFDQLNTRLNKLIRTMPLYLNFQDIQKSKFDQFCKKLSLNPCIKQQIYSLGLSNKYTYGQIEAFLSYFSLNEFSQLRSLTLIDVKSNNINKLKLMLPLLSELTSFRLFESKIIADELISVLPISKLQHLSILSLNSISQFIQQITSIKYLTLSSLSLNELCQLLRYTSRLEYLNVSNLAEEIYDTNNYKTYLDTAHLTYLKSLILIDFECNFDDFEYLIKHTPNVKYLTISAYTDSNMINAHRWQQLIVCSLPKLKTFRFKFAIYGPRKTPNIIVRQLEQFQSDFWIKEHQWYDEYSLTDHSAFVYTIPYLVDSNSIPLHSIRYIHHMNTSDHVKELNISDQDIRLSCQYYFSNVTLLRIVSLHKIFDKDQEEKFVPSLEKIVNLFNVTHIDIPSNCSSDMSCILFNIIKQTPHFSTLSIDSRFVQLLLNNEELSEYLHKMIGNLNLDKYSYYPCQMSDEMNRFYQIFSNIEHLTCSIKDPNDILVILEKLPKLTSLNVFFYSSDYPQCLRPIKDKLSKLNALFYENAYLGTGNRESIRFCVWKDGEKHRQNE